MPKNPTTRKDTSHFSKVGHKSYLLICATLLSNFSSFRTGSVITVQRNNCTNALATEPERNLSASARPLGGVEDTATFVFAFRKHVL